MNGPQNPLAPETHSTFPHLRSRMRPEDCMSPAEFRRLSQLRKRAALSRTAAVLRERIKKIRKN